MPAATDSLTATINSVTYTNISAASPSHDQAILTYLTGGSGLRQQAVGGETSTTLSLTWPAEENTMASMQELMALQDGTAKTCNLKNNTSGPSGAHPELQGSAVISNVTPNFQVGQLMTFTCNVTYSNLNPTTAWAES